MIHSLLQNPLLMWLRLQWQLLSKYRSYAGSSTDFPLCHCHPFRSSSVIETEYSVTHRARGYSFARKVIKAILTNIMSTRLTLKSSLCCQMFFTINLTQERETSRGPRHLLHPVLSYCVHSFQKVILKPSFLTLEISLEKLT